MRISLIKQFFYIAIISFITLNFQGCIVVGIGKDKSWYYTDDAKNIYSYPKIYKDPLSPEFSVQIRKGQRNIFIPFFLIVFSKKKYNVSLSLISHSAQNEIVDSLNYTIFNLKDSVLYTSTYRQAIIFKTNKDALDQKKIKNKNDSTMYQKYIKNRPLYKYARMSNKILSKVLNNFNDEVIINVNVFMKDEMNKTHKFKYIGRMKKSENKHIISAGLFTV